MSDNDASSIEVSSDDEASKESRIGSVKNSVGSRGSSSPKGKSVHDEARERRSSSIESDIDDKSQASGEKEEEKKGNSHGGDKGQENETLSDENGSARPSVAGSADLGEANSKAETGSSEVVPKLAIEENTSGASSPSSVRSGIGGLISPTESEKKRANKKAKEKRRKARAEEKKKKKAEDKGSGTGSSSESRDESASESSSGDSGSDSESEEEVKNAENTAEAESNNAEGAATKKGFFDGEGAGEEEGGEGEVVDEEFQFTDYGLRRRELAKLMRDRTNRNWWQRAADGNLYQAMKLFDPAAGCIPDWRNEDLHNRTALMEAAFRGQCSVCKWLVKRENARVDFSDSEGKTPLILAACGGHADVCEFLLTYHQSLSTAADTGGGMEARPGGGGGEGLPPGRADPEARDGSGWTALMWAVALDHYPCMQVLLDNGADYKEIGLPYPGTSKYNAGLSLLPLSAGIYKVEARAEGERRKMGERERIRKEVEARRRRWEEERAAKARKEQEDEEAYRKGIWRRVLTRR